MANAHDLLMAQRAAMMGGKLPYLRRVAYLESHGTEYIDTGIIPNDHMSYAKFMFKSNTNNVCHIAGCWNPNNYRYYLAYYKRQQNSIVIVNKLDNVVLQRTIDGEIHEVYRCFETKSQSVFDNILITGDFDCSGCVAPVLLFCIDYNGQPYNFSKSRIYRFTMLKLSSYKKVIDLIPVISLDGEPCFYDQVSGKFFYNQGEGEFTWGELDAT